MEEIWRDIDGCNGRYAVSTHGRVRGPQGKILKSGSSRGYPIINISGRGTIAVHLLVALAFLPLRKENVNHKDGDKTNNHLSNLEFCTRSENQQHAVNLGLKSQARKVLMIDPTSGNELEFPSCGAASRHLGGGASRSSKISKCARGETPRYLGFEWRYV